MSFAQALFLLGTLGVLAPILIHLLARPRYRRVPFTMLRFLEMGEIESQSKRKLRNFLLLLMRCSIVLLLALLFAGPRIIADAGKEDGGALHILGLDDSLSMAYSDGAETYFARALGKAEEYIREQSPDSRFEMYGLASGLYAKDVNASEALAWLGKLQPLPLSVDLSRIVSSVRNSAEGDNGRDVSLFILSDCTPQFVDRLMQLKDPAPVSDGKIEILSPSGPVRNLSIAGVEIVDTGSEGLKYVLKAANYGAEACKAELTGSIYGSVFDRLDVEILGGREQVCELKLKEIPEDSLYLPVQFSLSDSDLLPEDNHYHSGLSLPTLLAANVLIVSNDFRESFLVKTAMRVLSEKRSREEIAVHQKLHTEFQASFLPDLQLLAFTSIPALADSDIDSMESYVRNGGRVVFFASRVQDPRTVETLWERRLLPALPVELVENPVRVDRSSVEPDGAGDSLDLDGRVLASLSNYGLGSLLLNGYFRCENGPASEWLQRFENDEGFVFFSSLGDGSTVFVNMSADDSLGDLMKSPVAVAFCDYLLGRKNELSEIACYAGESLRLPATPEEIDDDSPAPTIYFSTPSGERLDALLVDDSWVARAPAETGWIKTDTEPVRYCGSNVPKGETVMTEPDVEEVRRLFSAAFVPTRDRATVAAGFHQDAQHEPVWRIVAWILLVMLLVETFFSNRVKR